MVFALMALEDIDGTNWCICIFYILLALLEQIRTYYQPSTGKGAML